MPTDRLSVVSLAAGGLSLLIFLLCAAPALAQETLESPDVPQTLEPDTAPRLDPGSARLKPRQLRPARGLPHVLRYENDSGSVDFVPAE